nr:ribonuclease H-like domain-containing protein [Tanacetum cinerariifolium]
MRIEQYFLMTDYSLWEVILNGDSTAPTRVVDGVLQPVAPTTAEQRLARKNELKGRGTLLMDLPDKHQLKFNSHKDAKTLMEDIEKRLQKLISQLEILGVSLSQEDINSNLKIYEAEVKSSSFASTITQNIAFVSSSNTDGTDEPVSAAASVFAISEKIHVSPLPNTGRNLGANGPTSMGFDMSKVECYNCHMKGHFTRECRSPKDTRRNGAAKPQRRNVPIEASTSNALVSQCDGVGSYDWSFKQKRSLPTMLLWSSHHQALLLTMSPIYDRYQSSNGYHVVPPPYTRTFMPPKPDLVFNNTPNDVETDHLAFNVSDLEDESETKAPQNVPSFVQSTEQVKSPRPSVQHVETSILVATPKSASPTPTSNGKHRNRKACFVCKSLDHLIKDCDYHEKKMAQPIAQNHAHRRNHNTAVRPVTTVMPKIKETKIPNSRPCLPQQRCIKDLKKSNPQHALKDKEVIDSGCSRHMTRNMSYLSDFEELNGGYVAFGGNPKSVILNGDSLVPTRIVEGVLQSVAPTTVEQKLARKNELKAHGTLLMALPKKHQLKFNSYKDAKILMEAIEKRFTHTLIWRNKADLEEQSLDDLFNILKIYEAEVKHSSSTVSAAASVSAVCAKMPVSSLPNVDSLSNSMAILTMRARRFLHKTGRNLGANGPTSMGFDMSKLECYNCHRKRHFAREYRSPNDSRRTGAAEPQRRTVPSSEQVKSLRHSIKPVETSIPAATLKPASPKSNSSGKRRNRKPCFMCKSVDHLIKDYDYHAKKMAQPTPRNYIHRVLTKSKLVSITAVRPVSAAVPKIKVTRPRLAHLIVTNSKSPIRRHITRSPSPKTSNLPPRGTAVQAPVGNPQHALKDKGVIDSGCSRHMTGNMSYLSDFEELNGGYISFRGNPKGSKISSKGKFKTGKLDFDDVYFVKELKFKLFSVSQICDKKNSVLFTDTECLVLSPDFKLSDESQVMLRVPRENNMYNVNLKNIIPYGDLTYLFAKATLDESNLWHRRLAHINFKTINKLVKDSSFLKFFNFNTLSLQEGHTLEPGTFTSIFKFPTLKRLAKKRWDEYGFVIHPSLVRVTCKSVRIDL